MTGFLITAAVVAVAIWVIIRVTKWLEGCEERVEAMVVAALAEDAATFGEPTRVQVEAEWWWPWMDAREEVYGPRAMWGPTDAEAGRDFDGGVS